MNNSSLELTITKEMLNESFKNIDNKYRKRLFDFIRRKVNSDVEAEDILQDVFYMFLNTLQIETIEKIGSWLYHVAENKIIDWYRKHKTVSLEKLNSSINRDSEDNDAPLHIEDILFDPAESPEELFIRSTVWSMLAEALDELPAEQKEVFVMHELEDKSFKEITELTGIPLNTLLSRKRYAILYLRERLKDLYDEFLND